MVSFICICCKSTSCSVNQNLAYQSVHHQVLSQSNGKNYHCYIKLMNWRVISTLNCVWESPLDNIDVLMQIWTCPILLLHWRNVKKIVWWIPIKFIWLENPLTFMDHIVSRRVCDNPSSWSFYFHWGDQVFWCLNYQISMCIGRFIAYLNPKITALVWFYQWFFHPISKPQAFSKLQYYHLPWIKCQLSNICSYRYIHMFWILW